jgi:hypothetical protein
MAQAKTSTRSRGSSSSKNSRSANARSSNARPSARSSNSRSGAKNSTRSRSNATRTRSTSRSPASSNGRSTAESVKDTVASGAQSAADSVSTVAENAKVPLLAGGAALAGLAGAVVLNARANQRRKVLGVSMPKRKSFAIPSRNGFKGNARKVAGAITDAAKRADHFGQRVSSVASGVQKVSETANDAAKKA